MNVPKLRFKEFNDDWIEEKINELVELNPKNPNLPENFIYIDLESVSNGILLQEKILTKDDAPSRAQRQVKVNDILYQTVRPYQKNNLFIDKLSHLPYIASTGYAILREKNIYQKFLFNKLHTDSFVNEVLDNCTGTSYPAINSNDLGNIKIFCPNNFKEQKRIGDFLSLIDKKIELQTKKIEDLKLFKKGLNKNIFSNFNAKYKIDELIKEYNQKTSKNNQFEVLSSTANGIILQNEFFNKQAASLDNTGYKIVPFGFITYRSMSDTGEFHFNIQNITENGIVSPAYPVFEINEDIVDKTYFIYYINENKSFKNKILSLKEGGTRYALSMSKFKEINLDLPPLEYQKKYSKLLNTYNRKIKNEENKLNKLQELKKGLMQNMFV